MHRLVKTVQGFYFFNVLGIQPVCTAVQPTYTTASFTVRSLAFELADELLDRAERATLALAVASSSPSSWVERHLGERGLLDRFAAVATGCGIDPLLMIVPATIAASFAFMMPVATPPNALVFASGEMTISQMCKAGIWLNVTGVTLVMLHMYFVVLPVLGI